jgi:hypothetical protein
MKLRALEIEEFKQQQLSKSFNKNKLKWYLKTGEGTI